MTEFPHLYPPTRVLAALSAEERIHRIRAGEAGDADVVPGTRPHAKPAHCR